MNSSTYASLLHQLLKWALISGPIVLPLFSICLNIRIINLRKEEVSYDGDDDDDNDGLGYRSIISIETIKSK